MRQVVRSGVDARAALVLGGLATWRLSHLLAHEDGPMQVVTRLRLAVDRTPLAGVMDCFNCTSVWVGLAVAPLALRGRRTAGDVALTAAGLSAAACLVERLTAQANPDDVPIRPMPEPLHGHPLVEVLDD